MGQTHLRNSFIAPKSSQYCNVIFKKSVVYKLLFLSIHKENFIKHTVFKKSLCYIWKIIKYFNGNLEVSLVYLVKNYRELTQILYEVI